MTPDLPPPLPPRDTALALPPSELAGPLLAFLEQRERSQPFHRPNVLRSFDRDIARALAEAWAWLVREGLVIHAPDNDAAHVFLISRAGFAAVQPDGFEKYRQATLLQRAMLHPAIAERAWLTYLLGDYDTAVFAAFKAVEVAVAHKSGCTGSGANLMRAAFDMNTGPLRDPTAPGGEREGRAHLFAGAFQTLRNPPGHRDVIYVSAVEPGEQLVVASHLMRIVEAAPVV